MRFAAPLCAALLAAGPLTAQATQGSSAPAAPLDSTAIRQRLARYVEAEADAGFSGSVAVAIHGRTVLLAAAGSADDARGTPNTPHTLFDIGSITKPFTAAAILRLEELGRLRVTDRLERFFPAAPADKRGVTLHQLLTHTAGFGEAVADDYEAVDREAFLRRAFAAPLAAPPGSGYRYSNVGYSILAAVVEVASGQGYEAFLREHLWRPAGMRRTGYRQLGVGPDSIAVGYRNGRAWGRPTEQAWSADGPWWGLRGNGGLLSTVGDLLAWDRALRDGVVLTAASQARATTRHVEEGEGAGTWYGYGWALVPTPRRTTLVTHNGGNGSFFADLLRYPEEGVTIALVTNRAGPAARQMARTLARIVFDPSFTPEVEPAATVEELTALPANARGALVGRVLDALRDGSEPRLRALVAEQFDARFAAMVPLEQHLRVLTRIGGEVRGRTIGTVRAGPEAIAVTLVAVGRPPVTLNVLTTPGAAPKVGGMGLDD